MLQSKIVSWSNHFASNFLGIERRGLSIFSILRPRSAAYWTVHRSEKPAFIGQGPHKPAFLRLRDFPAFGHPAFILSSSVSFFWPCRWRGSTASAPLLLFLIFLMSLGVPRRPAASPRRLRISRIALYPLFFSGRAALSAVPLDSGSFPFPRPARW
jgi:hypothetical protein